MLSLVKGAEQRFSFKKNNFVRGCFLLLGFTHVCTINPPMQRDHQNTASCLGEFYNNISW